MIIYTDGSCIGDRSGGFGVVVLNDREEIHELHSEQTDETTNNREELKAIIYAARHFGKTMFDFEEYEIPIVYSDSAYCVNTLTNWMYGWEARGWLKADNKVPENLDLIKEYFELSKISKIDLRKCAGHSGNKWNDLADALATNRIGKKEEALIAEYYKKPL